MKNVAALMVLALVWVGCVWHPMFGRLVCGISAALLLFGDTRTWGGFAAFAAGILGLLFFGAAAIIGRTIGH